MLSDSRMETQQTTLVSKGEELRPLLFLCKQGGPLCFIVAQTLPKLEGGQVGWKVTRRRLRAFPNKEAAAGALSRNEGSVKANCLSVSHTRTARRRVVVPE